MFRYTRLKIFYKLLRPAQHFFRSSRLKKFVVLMGGLQPGTKIVDLGGQPDTWDQIITPLKLTIINLPGIADQEHESVHDISYIEGDACSLTLIEDNEFEIAFSNSVIEHVGDNEKVKMFADEVQRIGEKIWIQTPSKYFPLECHTGMPFWWYYPPKLKQLLLERWNKKLPKWTEMVKGTTYITKSQLTQLFPGSQMHTERFLGLPKSYIIYNSS